MRRLSEFRANGWIGEKRLFLDSWQTRGVMRRPILLVSLLACSTVFANGQAQFQSPRAKFQYAPERTFDLKHLAVHLDVDYPNRSIAGFTQNLVAPIRGGLTEIRLHAGTALNVTKVAVDGSAAQFRRVGSDLWISVAKTTIGKVMSIRVDFRSEKQSGAGFGGGEGGWHWINANAQDPNRIGFWTQGETLYNRNWAPTWDYPNDFATSETVTTVPKDWTVVGNGVLVAEKATGDRKSVHWKMDKPHATYLLSLVGGPFDVKRDKWQDRDLWYVVPRGYGGLIDDSFGDTKDMLTFFSQRFGVTYPWPKYAQNAMHDFGGGMENVSSTTLGMGNLTDRRSGYFTMSGLNAHELAHQWFGDLVSCKNWGETWLNESWATFGQQLYFEHARGAAEYDRQVDGAMSGYFSEARRYRHPLSTNFYEHPDNMFDSHAYPKGASVLHTFRRYMGDDAFFAGVKRYLATYGFGPVETSDFERALTESSGINMAPLFDQWVRKPGHPVLEYTWAYSAGERRLTLKVQQKQSTEGGAPIYTIDTRFLVLSRGKPTVFPIRIDAVESSSSVTLDSAPDAVILDPKHDFLRELRHDFAPAEWKAIAEFAPHANDRATALNAMLGAQADESTVALAVRLLSADSGMFPVFESTAKLADLKRPSLRPFFVRELGHKSDSRRRDAVRALSAIGLEPSDKVLLGAMLTNKEMYSVVFAIIDALNAGSDRALLLKASKIPSRDDRIKRAAERKLANAG